MKARGGHDLLPFAGESAALVHDIVPAVELVLRLVAQAEDALRSAAASVEADRSTESA